MDGKKLNFALKYCRIEVVLFEKEIDVYSRAESSDTKCTHFCKIIDHGKTNICGEDAHFIVMTLVSDFVIYIYFLSVFIIFRWEKIWKIYVKNSINSVKELKQL